MSHPVPIQFQPLDAEALAQAPGRLALIVDEGGKLGAAGRKLDKLMRGALQRFLASDAFGKLKSGESADLAWPAGLAAEAVQVVKLDRKADVAQARKAGAAIGRALWAAGLLVLAETHPLAHEIAFGLAMRAYDFTPHKTGEKKEAGPVEMMVANPEAIGRGRVLRPRSGERTRQRADDP